ncbi:12440_t:CDS:2, partial [Gigaspora margarita]
EEKFKATELAHSTTNTNVANYYSLDLTMLDRWIKQFSQDPSVSFSQRNSLNEDSEEEDSDEYKEENSDEYENKDSNEYEDKDSANTLNGQNVLSLLIECDFTYCIW